MLAGIVIGLFDKFDIVDILKVAAYVKQEGEIPILLCITGKGLQEEEYKKLAQRVKKIKRMTL